MLPSHIPPQFPPHHAGVAAQPAQPSSAPQSTSAAQPDPVDLTRQFILALPMSPRSAGSALTRFVVPPRLPTLHDQLNDRAVLAAMKKIFRESSDWALKSTYGDGGTSILTYTHVSRTWSPKGPVIRFIVRPDKSLERLEIQMAQEVQTVLFQERLLPPHYSHRNRPAWASRSASNTGAVENVTAPVAPSPVQTAPQTTPFPAKDLTQPFLLSLVTDPQHPAFKVSLFMVPPRVRTHDNGPSDKDVITAIQKICNAVYRWGFEQADDAQGGRMLMFKHLLNGWALQFTIRPDNTLGLLSFQAGADNIGVEFEHLPSAEQPDAPMFRAPPAVEMPPLPEQEDNDTIDPMTQVDMEWEYSNSEQATDLWKPTGAPPETRAPQLHAELSSSHAQQPIEQLPNQRQDDMLVIDPLFFREDIPTHYDSMTVNGPDIDDHGHVHFYLERKQENAIARHAANDMIGAPLFSMMDFERHAVKRTHTRIMSAAAHVLAAFEEAGIPLHVYPTAPEPDGRRVTDPAQFDFLDRLDTDRLLLQATFPSDGREENSHWVAFRRVGPQWALLDSDLEELKIGMSPTSYLQKRGASDFTAFWPKSRLLVSAPASTLKHDRRTAGVYWNRDGNEFEPLLAKWKDVDAATEPAERTGPALLLELAELCRAQLEARRGTRVHTSLKIYEVTVMLEEEMEPVTVWCYISDTSIPYTRLAPATDEVEAREYLLNDIENFAARSVAHTRKRSPVVVAYDHATARSNYNSHIEEFARLLWKLNRPGKQPLRGYQLLTALMRGCMISNPQSRGVAVPGSNDLVFKFTVMLDEGMDPVRVFRGLDHNMKPYLRLAPEEGDDEARVALLRDFYTGDAVSAASTQG